MSNVQQLPGESVDQYRLRMLEEHREADVALLGQVRDIAVGTKVAVDTLVTSIALKESRASTLRVTLLSVAVAGVLGGVVTVLINVFNAVGHLATTGTPTP